MSHATALKPQRLPRASSWAPSCARYRGLHRALGAVGLAATLLLTACAESAPFSYYTLVGPAAPTQANQANPASAAQLGGAPLLIEVMPTNVPQQVQRPQLVLTTGAGQVKFLEQQRWSQPVADEISQALSQDLSRSLPAIDVYRSAHAENQAIYRIALNVQRFESAPGSHVTLDAVWSVSLSPRGASLTCHTTVNQPVAGGGLADGGTDYAALVMAHRQAIQQLAQQIGSAIGTLRQRPAGGVVTNPATPASGAKADTTDTAPDPVIPCPAAG
jgi:uncharacterized lipoprotein YmbA